jgi:hypothetical protein
MRRGTILLLAVLLAGPSAWAKKPPKTPPGPTDADVIAALKTVIAAADGDFATIKGDFDTRSPQNNQWKTSVSLPGSDSCYIVHEPRTPNEFNGAVISIQRDDYWYRCNMAFARGADPLLDRYDTLIKMVGQVTGWPFTPNRASGQGDRSVTFSDRPSGLKSPIVIVSIGQTQKGFVLGVSVFPGNRLTFPGIPPRTTAGSASPPGAIVSTASAQPSISQEIETVRNGAHSALPPIQSSGVPCRNGMCAFGVKNDTAYSLTVLFGGPSEQRVELAPSSSTSVNLLPGSYKIVGRVNAANVTPSYGDYVLDATSAGIEFYIAARP